MSIPRSAFTTGPLERPAHGYKRFAVYLDVVGAPPRLLGHMGAWAGSSHYRADVHLQASIEGLRWPRGPLSATAVRRAIRDLGSWDYCAECQHPTPCSCDWCGTCEMRGGAA